MSVELDELVDQLGKIETVAELDEWKRSREISTGLVRRIVARIQGLVDSDVKAALRLSEWAVSIALDLNDPFTKALALRAKAGSLTNADERFAGVEYFNEAIKIFNELGDELEVAKTVMSRITAYLVLSRFEEALTDADWVTEVFERFHDERRLARHLINIGHIYFRLDRFTDNLDILDRVETVLTRLNDKKSLCVVYMNRAVTLTSLNRAPDAFKYYELARQLAIETDMQLIVAECDYNICYLYFLQGQYTKALELLNVVRKGVNECGDRWHSALCNLDQSEIYLELNMHQDSIELAENAYNGFEPLGMRYEMAKAVAFMGIANNHLHNYGKALELFDRSRKMFDEQGNKVWLSLIDLYQGIVYFQTGRYYEGLDLARKAHEFFSKSGLKTKAIYAQLLVARLNLQLGNVSEAWTLATGALQTLGESPAPWLGYQIHYVMGDILLRQDNYEDARHSFRQAVEELEVLRTNIHVDELRMTFLKDKLKIYEGLVRTCLEVGDSESLREAFGAVEHAKSRTLVDLLANNITAVHPNRESDSQLVDYLRTIREELNWYYTRINLEEQKDPRISNKVVQTLVEEVHKRENQLIRLLRQVSSEPSGYVTLQRVTTSPLEEIQESLSEESVLIEYYVVDDQVIAFVITHDGFQVYPNIAPEESLRMNFELLRFQLTKFNLGANYVAKFSDKMLQATKEHLHELYLDLIPPIENALKGKKSITFVPHGFMHYFPFHALFDGEKYLIDRFEISYAPSATIYDACARQDRETAGTPLVIGVPDVRAPHIHEEVENIAAVFSGATVLVGADATARRLRDDARNAGLIHIASHGSFRNDNPMFSSIQLGDTWLSLFDIYNLKTAASLVTLSGCGTGMSKIVGGDELVGLARGFLYAGARSLVVSLWDVHDRSTAGMMKSFYGTLVKGLDRAQSLRSAILEVKKTHQHPYYWAPFILIGSSQ